MNPKQSPGLGYKRVVSCKDSFHGTDVLAVSEHGAPGTMLSVEDTQKVRNLRRDPRVSVVAETAGPGGGDVRGVIIQGRAEFLADGPERRALVERFHAKYSG